MNSKETAYQLIKNNIVNCIYQPGEKISENFLKESLNIGRTPIREALKQLELEGLIRIEPKRGIFISKITAEDIRDIYEIRYVLEPYALELAFPHLTESQLKPYYDYYSSYKTRDSSSFADSYDRDFHFAIYDASQSQLLAHTLKSIYDKNMRVRILSHKKVVGRQRNTCKEHYRLVEALLNRDLKQAKNLMKLHIKNGYSTAIRLVEIP